MADYLFTREPTLGGLDTIVLDRNIRAITPKVAGITVTQVCEPYAVFVHCSAPLTSEERAAIGEAIQQHRAV